MSSRLIDAAIALAWSEHGTSEMLADRPGWQDLFEPWPEMDDLIAALDEARPGWREQGPPLASQDD